MSDWRVGAMTVEIITNYPNMILARLYPKLRTRFSLSGKNPGFLTNTFSKSQITDKLKK
ncbi:MAG: hypothetical protein V7K90_22270 [Nostoc sp.]|uniref:hypothetical protein n=1 Tax=Nostoc sp. TaxID=1180 RepID=UPI002FFB0DF3